MYTIEEKKLAQAYFKAMLEWFKENYPDDGSNAIKFHDMAVKALERDINLDIGLEEFEQYVFANENDMTGELPYEQ